MGIEKTFTDLDAKLTVPPSLNEEQKAEWNKYWGGKAEEERKRREASEYEYGD